LIPTDKKNKVYWDDACYVCSFEVNILKKRHPDCQLEFVKISELPDKTPYMKEMIGEFEGQRTSGPDTIRFIYEELGYSRLVQFSRLPLIKQVFNLGYRIFAYGIRPFLPKRKTD
jgi:predicted DCC family thiol-disulfide oxidoreductase YuxK